MSDKGIDIRYDHDDPVSAAGRALNQKAGSAADRALQLAYMMQALRSNRVERQLDEINQGQQPDARYQKPLSPEHQEAMNQTVRVTDVVLIPAGDKELATVEQVGDDGGLAVRPIDRPNATVEVSEGQYQVLRREQDGDYFPTPAAAPIAHETTFDGDTRTVATSSPWFSPGDRVVALDRGNEGTVVRLDDNQAVIRFSNSETGASADVSLPLDGIRHHDLRKVVPTEKQSNQSPQRPGPSSGVLHPDGQVDPAKIQKRAKQSNRAHARPKSWPRHHRPNPGSGPSPS